ncbi:MAG: hypothetical protein NVSMB39_1520 [Candidatus Saccharimonadales bacterium]
MLVHALETILTLIHPIAPFVSEAIWSELPWQSEQLITRAWPVVDTTRTKIELSVKTISEFDNAKSIIQATRTITAEEQLSKPTILIADESLLSQFDLIKRLARATEVKLVEQGSGLYLGTASPAWIKADDFVIAGRRHRLEAQLKEKQTYVRNLQAKLSNDKYVQSAPAQVVKETRARLAETETFISKLTEQLAALKN